MGKILQFIFNRAYVSACYLYHKMCPSLGIMHLFSSFFCANDGNIIINEKPKSLKILKSLVHANIPTFIVKVKFPFENISPHFYFIIGRTKPEESDPRYLISLSDEFLFFLPEWFRKPLRFGYNYDRMMASFEKCLLIKFFCF